jgi:hypothetical protein
MSKFSLTSHIHTDEKISISLFRKKNLRAVSIIEAIVMILIVTM